MYRVAFRTKFFASIDELQGEFDDWMHRYNTQRTHQGRWCYGKTPMQTFLDSLQLAKDKLINQAV